MALLSSRTAIVALGLALLTFSTGTSHAQVAKPAPGGHIVLPVPSPNVLTEGCKTLAPSDIADQWTLPQTMMDDFRNFDPAHTRWTLAYYRPRDPAAAHTHDLNDEQQIYVDPSYGGSSYRPFGINPFENRNGRLNIIAKPLPPTLKPLAYNREYSSGMLQSHDFFSQLYGYFEAAIQIPAGQAMWPAFWLVPTDGSTPPELDVLESLGHKPEEIYSTQHWNYKDPKNGHLECKRVIPDATNRSVVYGVLWTPEMIVYYTDRVPVQAIRTHPTMIRPMYLILNLAVGGKWPGKISPQTPTEGRMAIDWVAAYRVEDSPNGAR
jgi:beta-glucanase (GH16 family)